MNVGKQIHEQNHYIFFGFQFPMHSFILKIMVQRELLSKEIYEINMQLDITLIDILTQSH